MKKIDQVCSGKRRILYKISMSAKIKWSCSLNVREGIILVLLELVSIPVVIVSKNIQARKEFQIFLSGK